MIGENLFPESVRRIGVCAVVGSRRRVYVCVCVFRGEIGVVKLAELIFEIVMSHLNFFVYVSSFF